MSSTIVLATYFLIGFCCGTARGWLAGDGRAILCPNRQTLVRLRTPRPLADPTSRSAGACPLPRTHKEEIP
jgi:hypothetical protein